MKKFSVPCDFNGVKSPFTIYIGSARQDHHPLHFQSDWLSKDRGGTIPQEIMDSLTKLRDLAKKNGVKFEDLCVYALGAAQQEAEQTTDETNAGDTAEQNDIEEEADTTTEAAPDQIDEALDTEIDQLTEEETKTEIDQTDAQELDKLLENQENTPETSSKVTEETNQEIVPVEEAQPVQIDKPSEEQKEIPQDKKLTDGNKSSSSSAT